MNTQENTKLIELAKLAAVNGGKAIMKHYADFKINLKADESPVTTADLAANEAIFEILSQSNIPICSEERLLSGDEMESLEKFWLIDPLDGTKDFIARTGEFCVCIALISQGRPILSAIYVPISDELYWADESSAYKNNEILSHNVTTPRLVLNGSHNSPNSGKSAIISELNLERKKLSSAIKYCYIAQNKAVLHIGSDKMSLWDAAAGDLILAKSGGALIDLKTKKAPLYNTRQLKLNPTLAIDSNHAHLVPEICEIWDKNKD